MNYFSVPADFNEKTIDSYYSLNNKYRDKCIKETYGQMTICKKISSGRLRIPEIDYVKLKNYVQYSQERGIEFNYTLNGLSMNNIEFTHDGIKNIISLLNEVYNLGIRNLTVTLPSLIELIQYTGLDFKIKASTMCQISNANKASDYKKLGVNRIVLDESINRDFNKLKDIRSAFEDKIEVIVNTICNKDCIYKIFHYNQIANEYTNTGSNASAGYYPNRCMMWRYENISNLLKLSWIRPEDIKHYYNIGINHFKIQGRQLVLFGDPVKTVECYFNEYFDGNLLELLNLFVPNQSYDIYIDNRKLDNFIKPFVEGKLCESNCNNCNYCFSVASTIGLEKQYKFKDMIKNYIYERDEFRKIIKLHS